MRSFNRNKIRNLRLSKGYSMERMARLLAKSSGKEISRSAISHWELGKTTPSLQSVLAVGELFEVPVDYFFDPQTNYLLDDLVSLDLHKTYEPFHVKPDAKGDVKPPDHQSTMSETGRSVPD